MTCLSCGSENIYEIYNFGLIPLVNSFSVDKNISDKSYPLNLVVCRDCKCCQLDNPPSGDLVFKDYKHFSKASDDNVKHLKSVSEFITDNFKNNGNVLEIGCNDGTLMEFLDNGGCNVVGIDPAQNMSSEPIHVKCGTIFKHFDVDVIDELHDRTNGSGFDVIVGLNVFAHFPSVQTAFSLINKLLSDDGVFVFEVAYALDTVFSGYYDTVYHEHVFNHTLISLSNMLKLADLDIIHVSRLKTQGGSLRVVCNKPGSRKFNIDNNEHDSILNNELSLGMDGEEFYQMLHDKISNSISVINNIMEKNVPDKASSVALIGAPARGVVIVNTTLLSEYNNLLPIDDTLAKRGTFFPGTNATVRHWDDVGMLDLPNTAVLLSWNYKETMINKLMNAGFKGKVLNFFPKLEIVEI